MTRRQPWYPLVIALTLAAVAGGAPREAPAYGPPNGSLVLAGGGSLEGTGIVERFIELAGGQTAKFVVVPTAGGNRHRDGRVRPYDEREVVAPWIARGLKYVRMFHTPDPREADGDAFVQALREADAVWFNGGRQWHIVDSYRNTRAYREFHQVLARGGVIGGSSAGATVQGEYLVRGDTSGPNVVMTDEPDHQEGFRFLQRTAIDQHINTRNRWDDLVPVIQRFPHLLGIGLSEGTAIVVRGDRFEVLGTWKVAVHDNTRPYQPWEKPYYVLSPGDVYNMKTRRIESLGTGARGGFRGSGGSGGSGVQGSRVPRFRGSRFQVPGSRFQVPEFLPSRAGPSPLVPSQPRLATWNPGTSNPGTSNPGTSNPGTSNPGTPEPWNPGTLEPPEPRNPGTLNPGTPEPRNPGTPEPRNPGTLEPPEPPEPSEPLPMYTTPHYLSRGLRSMFSPELKKGSTEMLVLSLLESRPRHGYEIGKLIEERSGGRLTFALPTLYPTLLRLENRGWIKGRWIEKAGQRERCFYRLTSEGRRVLERQRKTWREYVAAVNQVMGTGDA